MKAPAIDERLDRSQRSYLLIALSALALTAVIGLIDLAQPRGTGEGGQISLYLALVLCMAATLWLGAQWLLVLQRAGEPVWLHAPLLITVWVLALVALPGFWIFLRPSVLANMDYWLVNRRYVPIGLGLVLTGMVCLWVAYLVALKVPHFGRLAALADRPISRNAVLFGYAATVVARAVRISVLGIAYGADRSRWGPIVGLFDQWIAYVEEARFLVLAIMVIQVSRGRWSRRLLFAVLGVEFVYAFTTGTMKAAAWLLLVIVLAAVYGGFSIRAHAPKLLVVAVLVMFVVPVTQGIRQSVQRFETRTPIETAQLAGQLLLYSWREGPLEAFSASSEYVIGRMAGVAYIPGLIMMRTPSQIPFQGLGEFLRAPAYLVPRVLWPSKPTTSNAVWFSVTYMNMPVTTQSSTAITLFGEGFIFAGWLGTMFALSAYGLLLAVIFRNTVGVGLVPVYLALAPSFIDVEAQFTSSVPGLIQMTVVFTVMYWLLTAVSPLLSGTAPSEQATDYRLRP